MTKAKPIQAVMVPKEYGGQWIAWNQDHTAIVASGRTLPEVATAARESGEPEPGFEWVPPADCRIIGGGR